MSSIDYPLLATAKLQSPQSRTPAEFASRTASAYAEPRTVSSCRLCCLHGQPMEHERCTQAYEIKSNVCFRGTRDAVSVENAQGTSVALAHELPDVAYRRAAVGQKPVIEVLHAEL